MTASVDDILACISETEFRKDCPPKEKPKDTDSKTIEQLEKEIESLRRERDKISNEYVERKEICDRAIEDIKKLLKLHEELSEKRCERRDARTVHGKRVRNYEILILLAGIVVPIVIMLLTAESGFAGVVKAAVCMVCTATICWAAGYILSFPDDPLTKQYLHSLDMEIGEIEREIKDMKWRYQTGVPLWLRR